MQNNDTPFGGGAWIPPVRGTEAEHAQARSYVAGQAVRLAPDDPAGALRTVLAHLGLLPGADDALETREVA